ncbi:MAG: betaine/proline/choline family ABC transporter ATP-binding protein [Actinobacteria bacterium]|nr:betaine/proline/choline family ABC transporter ATP-binding protein [Actinomycetota bacterium]
MSQAHASAETATAEALIHLDAVTKVYAGTEAPAVDRLTLDVPEGEILILVGPSGCGKSTTLRLINRMIEPTSGRIVFEGEDVTDVNPDQLRRRIGYVIQQIGLFPHRTIAENIGTVPQLLGWDKTRISGRVDELLEMVGMEPHLYRDRYPKELSGGQAQRVGVARALGADPDVLLMDEPFGAIDPITRDRLQNEFLRLQAELRKTIVFVTHDIDEAIKMGDRIAILGDSSAIAQLDTPERILAQPANEFVEDFLGGGATLKGLNLRRVREIEVAEGYPVIRPDTSREQALAALRSSDEDFLLLLDAEGSPTRWLDEDNITDPATALGASGLPVRVTVEPEDTLADALEFMLQSAHGTACVVDSHGRFDGMIRLETIMGEIASMQRAAREASAERKRKGAS